MSSILSTQFVIHADVTTLRSQILTIDEFNLPGVVVGPRERRNERWKIDLETQSVKSSSSELDVRRIRYWMIRHDAEKTNRPKTGQKKSQNLKKWLFKINRSFQTFFHPLNLSKPTFWNLQNFGPSWPLWRTYSCSLGVLTDSDMRHIPTWAVLNFIFFLKVFSCQKFW